MWFLRKAVHKPDLPHTVSLHQQTSAISDLEKLLEDAVDGYRRALESVAEHHTFGPKPVAEEHRRRLRELANLVASNPSTPTFTDVIGHLDAELAAFGKEIGSHLREQEREAREVMAIMAAMAESMADREKHYNVRFRGISKKLKTLASCSDMGEIRRRLVEELSQLRYYADDMARDTGAAVARLQEDLTATRCVASEPPDRAGETAPLSAEMTEAD